MRSGRPERAAAAQLSSCAADGVAVQVEQYTSLALSMRCREAEVRPSTGPVGDAYNSMAEAFFATLECELLDRRRFRSQDEARIAVFPLIKSFYSPARRHSALGYLSPIEFEARKMLMKD